MNKRMFEFWLDRPVPYCCRDCVPKQFQQENQLYEYEMYGKVGKGFKDKCPKFIDESKPIRLSKLVRKLQVTKEEFLKEITDGK